MKMLILLAASSVPALFAPTASAQDHSQMDHAQHQTGSQPSPPPAAVDHSKMDHSQPDHSMAGMDQGTDKVLPAEGSGTSRLPGNEGGMHGVHIDVGNGWMAMAHGYAWGVYTDQGGPRGDDKAYVQSMAMLSASGPLGDSARLSLKSMFSLEPIMSNRGYPNLFATGETAGGEGLIDRQHPHDFFMELAARIDLDVAPGVTAFVYGGPVGEPALGPSAFMHRRSARYNPEAPITHHWFDATHITYGVVTAGISTSRFQIEGSAFRGREPDEERWGIETPKLDSWSARLTWNPSPNWSAQVSHGRLKSPETLHPDEDEARTTASIHYATSNLSVSAAFSNKNRVPGETLTAWLLEGNWNPSGGHNLFARIENVNNDELFPEGEPLHGQAFRVTKAMAGYAYRIALSGPFALAVGGSVSTYDKPRALDVAYGRNPMGYTLFAKLSLGD